MKKVNNRRLIGDGYSYSPLARQQNLKRFPALLDKLDQKVLSPEAWYLVAAEKFDFSPLCISNNFFSIDQKDVVTRS